MDRYETLTLRNRRSMRRDVVVALVALVALAGFIVALATGFTTLGSTVATMKRAGSAVAHAPVPGTAVGVHHSHS